MKYFVSLFFAIFVLVAISFFAVSNFDALKNSASLFFAQLSSTREIREKHTTDKVKILLVPGHEEDFGGKEYRGIKERDLNVLLANHLYDLFSKDKGVAILNVKDNKGNFSKWFSDYTKENELAIKEFRNSVRANFKKAINDGFEIKNTVTHNKAP